MNNEKWRLIPCKASIKNPGRTSTKATASISKTGVISISRKSIDLLGEPTYLLVYVNDDEGTIKLKASRKHPSAFTVSGEQSRIKVAELKSWHGRYRASADSNDSTAIILKRDYTKP